MRVPRAQILTRPSWHSDRRNMGGSEMPDRASCRLIAAALAGTIAALSARADDAGDASKQKLEKAFPAAAPYSPYAGRDFATQPFFGDTHLHTAVSFDAGAFGARIGPRDAYRLARGEEITASSGQPVKLSRPLDFLVVADHSDNMGFFPDLLAGKPELLADPTGRRWRSEE